VKTGIQTLFPPKHETIILETGFPASSAGEAVLSPAYRQAGRNDRKEVTLEFQIFLTMV